MTDTEYFYSRASYALFMLDRHGVITCEKPGGDSFSRDELVEECKRVAIGSPRYDTFFVCHCCHYLLIPKVDDVVVITVRRNAKRLCRTITGIAKNGTFKINKVSGFTFRADHNRVRKVHEIVTRDGQTFITPQEQVHGR